LQQRASEKEAWNRKQAGNTSCQQIKSKKGTHIVLSAMKKVMDCFDDVAL